MKYTVAVLVDNQFGVLNRVTSMFRRRQFNIDSLTVSETESPLHSRITVIFDGEEDNKQQLINQLYKLPVVCAVHEMDVEKIVSAELLLIKMQKDGNFNRIAETAGLFGAVTVDECDEAIMLSLSANSTKVDEFINHMRKYTILELCRTGSVSLEKGPNTILQSLNF